MIDIYSKAICKAMTHRRTALHIELAVALCVAYDYKAGDPAEGRAELVRVYADAGFDCLKPAGRDYKTINRRVNMAWLLWDHLGARKVKLGKTRGMDRVNAAKAIVAELGVATAYDVMDLVGRPQRKEDVLSNEKSPTQKDRRASDNPEMIHIKTRHIDVSVPPTATRAELLSLVKKLSQLAEKIGNAQAA